MLCFLLRSDCVWKQVYSKLVMPIVVKLRGCHYFQEGGDYRERMHMVYLLNNTNLATFPVINQSGKNYLH